MPAESTEPFDRALYQSKRSGRDCVTHFDELQEPAVDGRFPPGSEDSALRIVGRSRSAEHRDPWSAHGAEALQSSPLPGPAGKSTVGLVCYRYRRPGLPNGYAGRLPAAGGTACAIAGVAGGNAAGLGRLSWTAGVDRPSWTRLRVSGRSVPGVPTAGGL